jgi:CBS domain-containing protein
MTPEDIEYVTTECPNGHRVRGDSGWLHRSVRCPHCEAEFRFDRPESNAAVVTDVRVPPPVENRSLSDTGVMRIIDAFGKPVVPPDDGSTRHCRHCGAVFPSDISVCYSCNLELDPPEPVDRDRQQEVETVEFQPVDPYPFEDVAIREVMRPRKSIVSLDVSDSRATMLQRVWETSHSVYPVCDQSLDQLIGTIDVKQIVFAEDEDFDVHAIVNPAETIPDSMSARELLAKFDQSQSSFALVVDESGTIIGMVTEKDMMLKLKRT